MDWTMYNVVSHPYGCSINRQATQLVPQTRRGSSSVVVSSTWRLNLSVQIQGLQHGYASKSPPSTGNIIVDALPLFPSRLVALP